ncbi:hypothetical protein SP21_34 [Salmonella phage 21]|nr:hypothetical protein SP21_34 [Salmonella phage 21]
MLYAYISFTDNTALSETMMVHAILHTNTRSIRGRRPESVM